MNAINLIPPDLQEQRESRRRARRWMFRLGVQFLLLAAIFGAISMLARGRNAEAARLTRDYTILLGRFRGAQALLDERARLEQRRHVIRLIRDETLVTHHLRSLGESLTNDSYLVLVEFHRESSSPGEDSGGRFLLRGHAPGHAQVGEILRSLAAAGPFEAVRLVSAQEQTGGESSRWVLFEVDLRLCRTHRNVSTAMGAL